jgi:GNAT superfamily N-acetyltransferase
MNDRRAEDESPVRAPGASSSGFIVREIAPADFTEARALVVRVLEEDLDYGYRPEWHWDIDDFQGTYVDNPRQGLFVAVDEATGELLGTSAVRAGGPNSPPHPAWLADRYRGDDVAQVYRVYIAREHRRRGVASALVGAVREFVDTIGDYRVIYLHTDPTHFNAVDFWRRMPTREVYDGQGTDGSQAVHFELAFPDGAFEHPKGSAEAVPT